MTDEALTVWAEQSALVRTVVVGCQDIARFAIAVGATDAVHVDPAVARARGFADVVAPALFYVALRTGVFNLVPQDALHEEGTPLRDIPPITFRQAMAGETSAELFRPFVAGDVVTCARRVESTARKEGRSGTLTFITFEYRYADADDDPFAVEHFTRIFR
ncbi:MAG: MaoC family dehydratase N-terminal domain-containing protein [Streptosporangiales bacterium]|nr:MaoC family dehydratase N-terminal domain-containing protein [Streptosporangiales bacterium]MBO0889930.1 MaoC family dehydratase N-terminal domain-containing protein [Acidothermales bacterium]